MSTAESQTPIDSSIQKLVANAHNAQMIFESFTQEQVDAIVRDIGKFVYDNAESLARMAVDETDMGSYEDKILKNKGKARVIWNNLKNKKSRGVIGEDTDNNLMLVAKPMGVVRPSHLLLILSSHQCVMVCLRLKLAMLLSLHLTPKHRNALSI